MMIIKALHGLRNTSPTGGPVWKSILPRYPAAGLIRSYASQTSSSSPSGSSRKHVTIVNDDGRVQWKDLSIREKAARTTQQTFNFGVVLTGLFMTGGVIYLLYTEVFAKDSKISHFNRAVDRIRADPQVKEILGSGTTIKAYGEPTLNKLARARPISSKSWKDAKGAEHIKIHFNVEGSSRSGEVNLHMMKKAGESNFQYKYLALDVEGHPRIYLENEESVKGFTKKAGMKMFGVNWR